MFCTIVQDTLFSLYYVDVFLNVHGLTNRWFYVSEQAELELRAYIDITCASDSLHCIAYPFLLQIGQSIYIFWNAINDPLFAYWQDRTRGSKRSALYWGGPLLALSFLLPFLPVGAFFGGGEVAVGLHFLASICFFDGVFTYTCLAHCALFAEITSMQSERLSVLRAGELSMMFTAPLVLLASHFFVREALAPFRMFAFILAIACAVSLVWASKHVRSCSDLPVECTDGSQCSSGKLSSMGSAGTPSLRTFLSQFIRHRSMLSFMALNFLQVGTLAFFNNFFTIILSSLQLSNYFSWMGENGGMVLAGSQLLPPIIIIALAQPEDERGSVGKVSAAGIAGPPADRAYRVVRSLTLLKIALSLCMLLIGFEGHILLFALFLFASRALASATFAFFNVILSELIDEDRVTNARTSAMSSSYFGLNALVTKPAQSIAPVLAVNLWSQYGFRDARSPILSEGTLVTTDAASASADPILSSPRAADLQYVIFLCCTLGPLLIGIVQALIWRSYSLHGVRLQRVKNQLHAMTAGVGMNPDVEEAIPMERIDGTTDDEADHIVQSQQLLADGPDKRRQA